MKRWAKKNCLPLLTNIFPSGLVSNFGKLSQKCSKPYLTLAGAFAENEYIKKSKLCCLCTCWTRLFVPELMHFYGITELTLPSNFDITIWGFLSASQVKEKNNWSTFTKHAQKSCVMAVTELLCHFQAHIFWDFVFMFGHKFLGTTPHANSFRIKCSDFL